MDSVNMRQHSELKTTATNRPSEDELQWPTLLGRMLEDLSRIFQLELQLLEARLGPSLMAVADRAIGALVILYAGVIGGSCLVAALILLLHTWLVWWQCFAIGGLATLGCAFAVHIGMSSSSASD
jgi:hypothetical protein